MRQQAKAVCWQAAVQGLDVVGNLSHAGGKPGIHCSVKPSFRLAPACSAPCTVLPAWHGCYPRLPPTSSPVLLSARGLMSPGCKGGCAAPWPLLRPAGSAVLTLAATTRLARPGAPCSAIEQVGSRRGQHHACHVGSTVQGARQVGPRQETGPHEPPPPSPSPGLPPHVAPPNSLTQPFNSWHAVPLRRPAGTHIGRVLQVPLSQ